MEEIDLKEFLTYLKKYIVLFVIAALVAVAGSYFYNQNFKTPLYSASSSIVLYQNEESKSIGSTTLNDINVGQKLVSTYSTLIKSELVLQQTINELHLDMSYSELNGKVSVKTEENTMLLSVVVMDTDPIRSAAIANNIAQVFTREIIARFGIKNINIWDEAKVPTGPSNMSVTRDMFLSAIIAVFGVAAIAFLIFYFDDTVKNSDDLSEKLGLPIAGKIVKSDIVRKTRNPKNVQGIATAKAKSAKSAKLADKMQIPGEIVVLRHPKSSISESIKGLRTNLQFTSVDKRLKTILVTSSIPGEGKSFISTNLAASFAQTDKKILLVDCDLRRGRLHKIFNLPNTDGLSNLLADDKIRSSKYIRETSIENLSVITRGTCPPNPSELLSSNKNRDLISQLTRKFDLVIFDGAPCNNLTDSIVMSTLVDETLIVARNGYVPRSEFNAAKENLQKVEAKIGGVVLNQIGSSDTSYYSYYSDEN